MTDIDQITRTLEQALAGESPASFKSPEFAELIRSINAVYPDRVNCEALGHRVLQMLLARMSAAMHTEREIQILKYGSEPLC